AGQVRLWPSAESADGRVLLGDVARLTGFDAAMLEQLNALPIKAATLSEGAMEVTPDDIRKTLDAARVNLAQVTLLGAAHCAVTVRPATADDAAPESDSQASQEDSRRSMPAVRTASLPGRPYSPPVDLKTLEAALRSHIEQHVGDLGGRLEIRFGAAHRSALALRTDDADVRIRARQWGSSRLGMQWFDVEIVPADLEERPRMIPILAEITLLRRVVIAARIVNRGQIIAARDVRLEERPFKRREDVTLTEPPAVIGMEARRALRPGDLLKSRDIRRQPLVRRNRLVTVWSREGGVIVRTAGRALRDGWLGEALEIRSAGSDERFFATVSGPSTVEVGRAPSIAMTDR
ncbi:MAG: flagellar basal body P-ring formation chaperone FlgA, partial [Phycisphaerae bacterium]